MRLFSIPVFDTSGGITHISTTWQVSDSTTFTTSIMEISDSTEFLNIWQVNLAIPIGEQYYVRAKRNLISTETQEPITNTTWIGPKKIINQDSSENEALKPEFKIEEPYVKDIQLDATEGLTITLNPAVANVSVTATNWVIKDKTTNSVIFRSINDTLNKEAITIDPSTYNFYNTASINIYISFVGELSIQSKTICEEYTLFGNFYELVGRVNEIDPRKSVSYSVNGLNGRGVTLSEATLLSLEKTHIASFAADSNTISIPETYFSSKTSYILRLNLTFIDTVTGEDISNTYDHYISTMALDESSVYKPDYPYDDVFEEMYSKAIEDVEFNTETSLSTEQFYSGVIPIINTSGTLSLYAYNNSNTDFLKYKDIPNITLGLSGDSYTGGTIELLPDNKLLILTSNNDKVAVIKLYNYNPYSDTFTSLLETTITDKRLLKTNNNGGVLLNNKYYFLTLDSIENELLLLYYIDLETNTLIFSETITIPISGTITNFTLDLYNGDRLLLLPKMVNNIHAYIYDISKNTLDQIFTIPDEFRNIDLQSYKLKNGSIIYFKSGVDDPSTYNYMVVTMDGKINVIDPETTAAIPTENSIKMKDGSIYRFTDNSTLVKLFKYS